MTQDSEIISRTLPISFDSGLNLSLKEAREIGEELSGSYCFAEPYPHIVIDNFLPTDLADKILANFPLEALDGDVMHEGHYAGHHKRQIFPNDCNDFVRRSFDFFNSASFLQFLEGLTTISGIIPDPYFAGGGFHETSRGGQLGIHADFRVNERLHLNRRLNVLIYLNKDWNESYGGYLEVWDRNMKHKVRSVAPIFNRCVIFNTDADSYHGHPDPLNTPDHIKRRSIALYYYTASKKVYEELPSHSTMYAARPTDGPEIRKQVLAFNAQNYKRDWIPPVILNPKLLLPPFIYRRIKSGLSYLKSKRRRKS
ncbi:2OG-Fe(II) oxygenase [Polynucleobacter sp. MWH-Braz-FAM2G]|uniref:2OG-Fe(II) oxygenase n=1 Tax=Polynucleobacter sp. MWH-Braz-FAM2G TaxID=1855883 RepID=UPI001BFD5C5B|nr:2OG-Fe(II) oxygenase [Polynucleobacter sp. MWH-Braz-FAM2G]QWD90551.1 2OG-Fe(II) oxygenase [Polynucleobacter sp. MWH-Braz-FAM2G]